MNKKISVQYKPYPLIADNLDKDALAVVRKLVKHRFQAYLVGGCVRDLLLGIQPKDFDVVTNAKPEQVKQLFKRTRLVGRRFRLAHILCEGYKYIEVATFRGAPSHRTTGLITRDNVYGTIEQDVMRRDLTINALYYDVNNERIVDFIGGLEDLERKKINIIGDANTRYQEDPVRMLRVIRFSAKLGFSISQQQVEQIRHLAHLLHSISPARLFEETLKLFHNEQALKTVKLLVDCDVWRYLFHQTVGNAFIDATLTNTQERFGRNLPLAPAFIFAVLLWRPFLQAYDNYAQLYKSKAYIHEKALYEVIDMQNKQVMIPKWVVRQIGDIWSMQQHLEKKHPKKSAQLLTQRRFRAAYDFLLLRSSSINPELAKTAAFWTKIQR